MYVHILKQIEQTRYVKVNKVGAHTKFLQKFDEIRGQLEAVHAHTTHSIRHWTYFQPCFTTPQIMPGFVKMEITVKLDISCTMVNNHSRALILVHGHRTKIFIISPKNHQLLVIRNVKCNKHNKKRAEKQQIQMYITILYGILCQRTYIILHFYFLLGFI